MDEFDRLIALVLKEAFRIKYKAVNYTDTYTRKSILARMEEITDRAMYNHCIEDRVMMHEVADDYHEWFEKNADRLAKEDEECRLEMKEATIRRQNDVDTSNDRI